MRKSLADPELGGCVMLLRRRSMLAGFKTIAGKLGSIEVGKTVTIASVGDFILVHQGNPDKTRYDASCNGTWLLLADAYEAGDYTTYFGSSNNYSMSTVAGKLVTDFDTLFTGAIAENILTVKIPYYDITTEQNHYLADGFQCKSFLPAAIEMGYYAADNDEGNEFVPADGHILSYFVGCLPDTVSEDPKRACSARYWHRSACTTNLVDVWTTSAAGRAAGRVGNTQKYAIRPMIIMSKYTEIDGTEITVSE